MVLMDKRMEKVEKRVEDMYRMLTKLYKQVSVGLLSQNGLCKCMCELHTIQHYSSLATPLLFCLLI